MSAVVFDQYPKITVKRGFDIKDAKTVTVWLTVVAGAFFLSNVGYGAALGCVVYTVLAILQKPEEGKTKMQTLKEVGIPAYILAGLSLITLLSAAWL